MGRGFANLAFGSDALAAARRGLFSRVGTPTISLLFDGMLYFRFLMVLSAFV